MSIYLKATMNNGNLVIYNHDQVRDILRQFDGKQIVVHIEEYNAKASAGQIRWYWGVAIQTIIIEHKNKTGEILTKDEVHAFNLNEIVKPRIRTKEVLGKTIIEIDEFSLSKMNKKEFIQFKDNLQQYWSLRDIYIPDPREDETSLTKHDKAYESLTNISSKKSET